MYMHFLFYKAKQEAFWYKLTEEFKHFFKQEKKVEGIEGS